MTPNRMNAFTGFTQSVASINCPKCAALNLADARFCDHCAANLTAQGFAPNGQFARGMQFINNDKNRERLRNATTVCVNQVKSTSQSAVLCLIAGLASWSFLPFIGAVLAIIFGRKAKQEIKASNGTLSGLTMVTIGQAAGFVQLALAALSVLGSILFILARYLLPVILEWLLK
jgi:hypothetical protein